MTWSPQNLRQQLLIADKKGFFMRDFQQKKFNHTTENKNFSDPSNECHRCKKGSFLHTARQTRSADEGMTLILICNYCGFQKQ